jgi:hypothetical protein
MAMQHSKGWVAFFLHTGDAVALEIKAISFGADVKLRG